MFLLSCANLLFLNVLFICRICFWGLSIFESHNHFFYGELSVLQLFLMVLRSCAYKVHSCPNFSNIFVTEYLFKSDITILRKIKITRVHFTYSGTPPYDHPVYKTTLLLRPYSFKPNVKTIESFSYFEDPVNATTSLLRPGFYGPTVVALTGFHCISKTYIYL